MADRGDGLAVGKELTDDLEHARIEADVLRSAAAGDVETGVVLRIDGVEVGREGEVVAAELGIGLLAEEVVNGGRDGVASLLVRTHGVDLIAEHRERLERHHGLVILRKIAAEQQNLRHEISPFGFPGGSHFPRRFNFGPRGMLTQSAIRLTERISLRPAIDKNQHASTLCSKGDNGLLDKRFEMLWEGAMAGLALGMNTE